MPQPRDEYAHRLQERQTTASALSQREAQVANLRLAVAVAGLLLAWPAISGGWAWVLVLPAVLFVTLVVVHDRVIHQRRTADRAVAFFKSGLARVDGQWAGTGDRGDRYRDPEHPYAEDLDLWGKGGLFERLCGAQTRAGKDLLAAWLQAPAEITTVRERQDAVRDLSGRLDLREELFLRGEELHASAEPGRLTSWGTAPSNLPSRAVRWLAGGLGVLAVGAVAAAMMGRGLLPLGVVLALEGLLAAKTAKPVTRVLRETEAAGRDLRLLGRLLRPLEQEPFQSALALRLQAELGAEGVKPSVRLAHLEGLLGWTDVLRNGVFGTLAWLLQLHIFLAYALEQWRTEHGPLVPRWLEVVGELEALTSLGAYAYEEPEDPFPELAEGGPGVMAHGLAHPLLPHSTAVANNLSLGTVPPESESGAPSLMVISGSNMSGKSTLMRALGTNCVLALAGAPVRAQEMRLTPLQLGTSLRISDSLGAGVSHFYAEIRRLRLVVDLLDRRLPLLFLLDEILHGTNSHDRRIGAEAVLRTLVLRGAIGLVSTHDLALTEIALKSEFQATNMHFQDDLLEGSMHFDYRLRDGVVRKSNALELMQAVGLEVGGSSEEPPASSSLGTSSTI